MVTDLGIVIKPISIETQIGQMVKIWNQNFLYSLNLTRKIILPHLMGDPNYDPQGLLGAYLASGELVGFVLGKRWQIPMQDMGQNNDQQWIRDTKMGIGLIAVQKLYQRKGIGTSLLKAIEEFFIQHDGHLISIGREPGKHFFPGIPEPVESAFEFFEKNGYGDLGFETAIDIMGDVSQKEEKMNYKLKSKIDQNMKGGFRVIPYRDSYYDAVLAFMKTTFPGKWYWTVFQFITNSHVAKDELQLLVYTKNEFPTLEDPQNFEIVGFAQTCSQQSIESGSATIVQSQGDPAFGGLGPIGISPNIRGSKGLGAMLLHFALVNLHTKGVRRVLIDWTSHGLLQRYYGIGRASCRGSV